MTRRRAVRLLVMPALILLGAWALTVNARQRETRRLATLERAVTAWCEAAGRGEEPALPVAPELPPDRVVEAVRSACRAGDAATAWTIAVAAGPGPAPSPGPATHHAMIRVDGAEALGLLLTCRRDRPLVVGYWLAPSR